MAYHDKLLYPNERVRSVARPHPAALGFRAAFRIGELVLLWLLARAAGSAPVARFVGSPMLKELSPGGEALPVAAWCSKAAWLLAALVLVGAVFDFLRWRETAFVLTDQRLLQVSGVLTKSSIDSPLDKITDVGLAQSALGRWLDYGDVLVLRNTEEGGNRLAAVERPLAFKQALHKARSAKVAVSAAPNLQAALKELLALREHGLVNPEEFESKKKDLLARF